MYQIASGEHPFTVSNEDEFRDDVLTANYDSNRLENYPRLEIIIENFLKVDPEERWDANMALAFAQEEFVIEIQRIWRGYLARLEFMRRWRALILIQAHIKGFVTKARYRRRKQKTVEEAVVTIQAIYRGLKQFKKYRIAKKALMRCQANVLTKQFRKAFLNTRENVVTCQMFIKRNLAMKWFNNLRNKKRKLDDNLAQINQLIGRHNNEAHNYKEETNLYKNAYQGYEVDELKRKDDEPVVGNVNQELKKLLQENKILHEQLRQKENGEEEEETKINHLKEIERDLGPQAYQLEGMLKGLKDNVKRVKNDMKMSKKLPIRIQHPYSYSKWDSINDPYNVVENILKDDDKIYKALTPELDLTLNNGRKWFVSEIFIHGGDGGPAHIEVYISDYAQHWDYIEAYECSNDEIQRITLPGENIAKYIRIKWLTNNQGGNIVKVRHVEVKGMTKE